MNSSQKFGLFLLIIITAAYVYFAFFCKDFKLSEFNKNDKSQTEYSPLNYDIKNEENNVTETKAEKKNVKIFVLDKTGNLKGVTRECDPAVNHSCFEFAISELLKSPTKVEKSKGYTSEIPAGTKLLSVRESSNFVMVDFSSDFEAGGGAESTYMRVKQVIKTVNANSSAPTYLYINGKQANVIGGEVVMLKQPLNERSLDE